MTIALIAQAGAGERTLSLVVPLRSGDEPGSKVPLLLRNGIRSMLLPMRNTGSGHCGMAIMRLRVRRMLTNGKYYARIALWRSSGRS